MQEQRQITSAVIALAGRRIDAADAATPRFPLDNIPLVRKRLAELLVQERAVALVCSAACGADLIALEEAERLGLRRRIVLPFAAERFRISSVIDRPGNWGPLFDRMIAAARDAGDLVVLDASAEAGNVAYAAANEVIVSEARSLAAPAARLIAVLVWEGAARPQDDATGGFQRLAAAAGFAERMALTV